MQVQEVAVDVGRSLRFAFAGGYLNRDPRRFRGASHDTRVARLAQCTGEPPRVFPKPFRSSKAATVDAS